MTVRAITLVLIVVLGLPSTVLAALGDCGQPVTDGENPTASDCLFLLRAAVGSETCDPVCICDTSGGGGTTATDALVCLKKAVGQTVELTCPCATTTTTLPTGGQVLRGVLAKTTGRFNYNLTIGLPGADAKCAADFPGTQACRLADLISAETAGDLDGLLDPAQNPVTSFWAIDPAQPDDEQCTVDVAWDYATAHTGQFAEIVNLDNAAGELGEVESGVCATMHWVGCCVD